MKAITLDEAAQVESVTATDTELLTYTVRNIDKGANEWRLTVQVRVQERVYDVNFILDTGSQVNIIGENIVSQSQLKASHVQFKPFGSLAISALGHVSAILSYGGKSIAETVYVVKKQHDSILGLNAIKSLGLLQPLYCVPIDKLDMLQCPPMQINLRNSAHPKQCIARRLPISIYNDVKNELHEMENRGIIQKWMF